MLIPILARKYDVVGLFHFGLLNNKKDLIYEQYNQRACQEAFQLS